MTSSPQIVTSASQHPIESTNDSIFHNLVADCRHLILNYHYYQISSRNSSLSARANSDINFALRYFFCYALVDSLNPNNLPVLTHVKQLHLSSYCECSVSDFGSLKNLVELHVSSCSNVTDNHLQQLKSLQVLHLENMSRISDEAFVGMRNLRELCISSMYGSKISDKTFEYLFEAGSRLEKVNVGRNGNISDRALSFLGGVKELDISSCSGITDEGLKFVCGSIQTIDISRCKQLTHKAFQYLRHVKRLHMCQLDPIDCHEAFAHLEGSIEVLWATHCNLDTLDAVSLSFLRGISELNLFETTAPNLTVDAFQCLRGIKTLNIGGITRPNLDKNLLWHLTGVEKLNIYKIGISVESEDYSRLKQVFRNVSLLVMSSEFVPPDVKKNLYEFIGRKGYIMEGPE